MLTDTKLRNLKPKDKLYKVNDRDGLYVAVTAAGAISFRYNYSIHGRQETITFGRYGVGGITLAEARELNDPRLLVTVDGLQLALPGDMAPVANDFSADLDEIDLGRADALRPGVWVEFRDAEAHRCRARLLGVVQPADTHVFGDPDGTVVRQLPRLRLALALREGSAIALDNVQFFDRALAQARSRIAVDCG